MEMNYLNNIVYVITEANPQMSGSHSTISVTYITCIACTKSESTTIGRIQPVGIEVMKDLGNGCNQQTRGLQTFSVRFKRMLYLGFNEH